MTTTSLSDSQYTTGLLALEGEHVNGTLDAVYFDGARGRWYVASEKDVTRLGKSILAGHLDCYSMWFAGTPHLGEGETKEMAIAALDE